MTKSYMAVAFAAASLIFLATTALADDVSEGRGLYMQYCAACHGEKGDGHGPVAKSLKESPGDLRRLGDRYGTPLPASQIARFIDGRDDVTAHGSREMPVWGERFEDIWTAKDSSQGNMHQRVMKIIAYLQTIQTSKHPGEAPPAPVGASH
ncbi:MAG TPA: cytochrome c [Candidatus Binataceae bacterium]|nr:cytochrome c [Candidatus Binataceae bacterium]